VQGLISLHNAKVSQQIRAVRGGFCCEVKYFTEVLAPK
jgi:hypothetical protein